MTTLFVQIGNSDDKLTQKEWAMFIEETNILVTLRGDLIGVWYSDPESPWQNACWMFKVLEDDIQVILWHLANMCDKYRQDAIAVTEARETEFIGPHGKVNWPEKK